MTVKRSTKRSSRRMLSEPRSDRPIAPGYGIVGAKDGKGLLLWS